jgi:hypothetical protein
MWGSFEIDFRQAASSFGSIESSMLRGASGVRR